MKLEEVPRGERVFVDANIFIYHFTRLSLECRAFLSRCESGEVQAFTGVHKARLFLVATVKEAPSATPPPGEMMKLYLYPSVCCFEFRGSFRYARAILTEAIVSSNY